jgi:hypothetical protein
MQYIKMLATRPSGRLSIRNATDASKKNVGGKNDKGGTLIGQKNRDMQNYCEVHVKESPKGVK